MYLGKFTGGKHLMKNQHCAVFVAVGLENNRQQCLPGLALTTFAIPHV